MIIIHTIGAIFIFAPFLAFLLAFAISRKTMGWKAIGLSADITTFLLFFSVPVSIQTLWGYATAGMIYFGAIMIGIICLVLEWRRSKEIEVLKYLRKLWRIYFLILSFAYSVIWLIGIIMTIRGFFNS